MYGGYATTSGGHRALPELKILRQYFKYVRPGAERIEATSQNGSFAPVAFINADGK